MVRLILIPVLVFKTVLALATTLVLGTTRVAAADDVPGRRVHPGGLAAALATALPGQTLTLLPGVHAGPFTVDVAVRLEGEPGAVVAGDGQGPVLVLTADGISVSDLTLRGSGADLSQDDAVVLLGSEAPGPELRTLAYSSVLSKPSSTVPKSSDASDNCGVAVTVTTLRVPASVTLRTPSMTSPAIVANAIT